MRYTNKIMDMNFWLRHFTGASLMAQAIYLLLLLLSVVAWAIIIAKIRALRRNTRGTRQFLELYRRMRRDLPGLLRQVGGGKGAPESPLAAVFVRGCEELQAGLSRESAVAQAARPRITPLQFSTLTRAVTAVEDKYFLDLEHFLVILATTVSAAPFLGLLGTVWGILEAFHTMGARGSTGVSAFGPGISEALITTVAGLVVAIPALLGYNFIGARIRELAGEADAFTADFLALIEREFVREDRP
jgi:biopolymer transport protein TolQ